MTSQESLSSWCSECYGLNYANIFGNACGLNAVNRYLKRLNMNLCPHIVYSNGSATINILKYTSCRDAMGDHAGGARREGGLRFPSRSREPRKAGRFASAGSRNRLLAGDNGIAPVSPPAAKGDRRIAGWGWRCGGGTAADPERRAAAGGPAAAQWGGGAVASDGGASKGDAPPWGAWWEGLEMLYAT